MLGSRKHQTQQSPLLPTPGPSGSTQLQQLLTPQHTTQQLHKRRHTGLCKAKKVRSTQRSTQRSITPAAQTTLNSSCKCQLNLLIVLADVQHTAQHGNSCAQAHTHTQKPVGTNNQQQSSTTCLLSCYLPRLPRFPPWEPRLTAAAPAVAAATTAAAVASPAAATAPTSSASPVTSSTCLPSA